MKRLFFLFGRICFAFLLFNSCTNKDVSDSVKSLSFSISPFMAVDDTPQTRTGIVFNGTSMDFVWSATDTCGIYPASGSQVWFAMANGAGASAATFNGGGWALKSNHTYYSYYPFIGNIYLKRNHIPVSFTGQKQPGTTSLAHIGPFDYMYAPGETADNNGHVNFLYEHLCCIIRPYLTLPAGTWKKLAISAPTAVFTTKGYYNLMAESPAIVPSDLSTQIQIELEGITLTEQTSFYVYILSAPVNLKDTQIVVSVLNDQKKEYQCMKTPSRVYEAGKYYTLTCASWEEVPQSMGLILEHWGDGGSISGTAD